ncbi:MAG: lipoyl(octanoyl) transferase LipB [Deltaproteobacteria bacterium]|nr:lipoyl(octanoyl) transferase LipB [Deltaproteobacteria bacterium]
MELKQGKTIKMLCVEIPVIDYSEALELQRNLVSARKSRIINEDIILLLEHPAVFTLGRRGGLENLEVSWDYLEKKGIPVIKTERGGDITFHGPGQLVGYPIVDIKAAGLSVTDYVERLEEVMIRTAGNWGIIAGRNSMNRGAWVNNSKLGSIGITVRRGITFHGFAFNVCPSLEPFGWINPCGLKGIAMTSLERELSARVPFHKVRESVKYNIEAVFGTVLINTSMTELQEMFKKDNGRITG